MFDVIVTDPSALLAADARAFLAMPEQEEAGNLFACLCVWIFIYFSFFFTFPNDKICGRICKIFLLRLLLVWDLFCRFCFHMHLDEGQDIVKWNKGRRSKKEKVKGRRRERGMRARTR